MSKRHFEIIKMENETFLAKKSLKWDVRFAALQFFCLCSLIEQIFYEYVLSH